MSFYQIPDFGTDLAISTRSELDPGDSTRIYAQPCLLKNLYLINSVSFFNILVQNSC